MMEECGYSSQHFGNEPGFPSAEVLTVKHCKGRKGPGGCSEVGPGSIELKGGTEESDSNQHQQTFNNNAK